MCILVAEDESLIRLMVAEELEHAGFNVCQAEDGDQAATLIEAPPIALSLVITDIHMPGRLDGLGLGQFVRVHHPNLPIIYVSGRPDAVPALGELRRHDRFLAKPFRLSELVATARQLLQKQHS